MSEKVVLAIELLGKGMLGIFVVIALVMVSVLLLQRFTKN